MVVVMVVNVAVHNPLGTSPPLVSCPRILKKSPGGKQCSRQVQVAKALVPFWSVWPLCRMPSVLRCGRVNG